MDSFVSRVSNLIRNRLNELNMTNAELAEAINVSKPTVGDWVSGISAPKSDKIVPLCNALKITVYEFLGVSDPTNISAEERKILEAYKEHPEMHEAVKTLLKIN